MGHMPFHSPFLYNIVLSSDPGPTISRWYTRHKWVGRMICSQAIVSACAQDPLRLPESMTIIKNRTDNLRFSFPLMIKYGEIKEH